LRRRAASLLFSTLTLAACGSESPTTTLPVTTETFPSFTIVDPDRCTCGNGLATYTVTLANAGTVDATATFSPADAVLVVRILDANFVNVLATSTISGSTARFTQSLAPGSYRIQVFLASSGPRSATFQLAVTHP
jgi:uncharacterized repeat protein (TIGR01451 family)